MSTEGAGAGEGSSMWQHMEADILIKIFMTLNIMDIVHGASQVCRSWRAACRDPVFWETVDLNEFGYHPANRVPSGHYSFYDGQSGGSRMMRILNHVSNLSGINVRRLIFNYFVDVRDEHLVFAARRFPGLKLLALPKCNYITVEGFRDAIQNWTGLESLIVEYIRKPCEILELIGTHCKDFSGLKIMFSLDLELAASLVTNVRGLKFLSVKNTYVEKDALNYFLTMEDDLVAVSISHNQVVSDRPTVGLVHVSPKPVGTLKVREFYWCDRLTCIRCLSKISPNSILRWYEHDRDFWRRDEIACLSF